MGQVLVIHACIRPQRDLDRGEDADLGIRGPPLVFSELVHQQEPHLVLLALEHFLSYFPPVLPMDKRVCVIYLTTDTIARGEY